MTAHTLVRSTSVSTAQRVLGVVVGLAAAYVAIHLFGLDSRLDVHSHDPAVSVRVSPAQQEAARLIGLHHCWTHAAPPDMRDKIPGHAVVTWPGGAHPVYGGRKAVGAALDHVFAHQHPQLQVHAFCR